MVRQLAIFIRRYFYIPKVCFAVVILAYTTPMVVCTVSLVQRRRWYPSCSISVLSKRKWRREEKTNTCRCRCCARVQGYCTEDPFYIKFCWYYLCQKLALSVLFLVLPYPTICTSSNTTASLCFNSSASKHRGTNIHI